MYRPGENIYDVRQRGIPWLAAAVVIVIISLVACLFFVLFDSRFDIPTQSPFLRTKEWNETYSFDNSNSTDEIYYHSTSNPENTVSDSDNNETLEVKSGHIIRPSPSEPIKIFPSHRLYKKAVVHSTSEICSEIGRNIMMQGGNVVDSIIATEICIGGIEPHFAGLGGGHILLIHTGNNTIVINGQSRAPRSVTENTYSTKPEMSREGYSSIGVPGELHSLWTTYKKFGSGRLPWQNLLWPTVELLERGFPISSSISYALKRASKEFLKTYGDKFPATAEEGDLLKNEELAETIRRIAQSRDPVHLFYKGEIANIIVNEMKAKGGLIAKIDLVSYESLVEDPLVAKMTDDFLLLGPSPPSVFAAAQLAIRLAIEKNREFEERDDSDDLVGEYIQRARVATGKIGDPQFVSEAKTDALNMTLGDYFNLLDESREEDFKGEQLPSKTNTIIVADSKGSVAVLSSTLFSNFGSQRISDKLGFVWNNEMGAFDLEKRLINEEEDTNGVQGSKRPRTALAPMLLVNRGQWKLATSAPGELQNMGNLIRLLSSYIVNGDVNHQSWDAVHNNQRSLSAICNNSLSTFCSTIRGY